MKEHKTIVIDANNAVLGRLASYVAKQSLLGNKVIVVNCNEAVITGRRAGIIEEYRESRARGGSSQKGPNFPKEAFRIVKRTVRGMLSYKQGRGEAALKRVICYNDIPKEYESSKKSIEIVSADNKKVKTLNLGELSRII